MADIARVKSNVGKMLNQNAPETDIDAYLESEGVTAAQLRGETTVPFEQSLDRKNGAPAFVRSVVGGSPQQDRLANLKRYYPDATPYGEDNFVFTDPQTKRPTLFNPKGLDMGDVAGVGREVTQAAGAALGTGVATAAGAATGGLGLAAIPVAAGLGTAGGGALWDAGMGLMTGATDTRSIPQRLTDTGIEAAAGAGGQRVGELMEQGGRAALGYGKSALAPAASRLYQDYIAANIRPMAGAISNSRAVQGMEQALANIPTSAGKMQEVSEQVLGQLKSAVDKVANKFGPVKDKQDAGDVIVSGVKGAAQRFKKRQGKLYDEAYDLVGADLPVSVNNVTALRKELVGQLASAPESLGPTLSGAINKLKALEADAARGLPFDAIRATRTALGKDLSDPIVMGATGSQRAQMDAVYGAISRDMNEAALGAGDDAAKAVAKADRYTRFNMNQNKPLLDKIGKYEDESEKAFNLVMQGSKDGGSRLQRLRMNLKPEEWDTLAGTMIGRLGLAKPGAQDATGEAFSVSTFMTNYSALSQQAKNALFGGNRYANLRPELDRLVRIAGSLKETDKMANPSGTARHMAYQATLMGLGFGGGAMIGGDAQSGGVGVGTVAGALLAPRAAAKLVTNPKFVRWLSDVGPAAAKPNGLAEHIGRLGGIAAAQPAIKDEVSQYLAALRSVPGLTQ
jgi:hypothetical protein